MSFLYHPMSSLPYSNTNNTTNNQLLIPNCPTPNNFEDQIPKNHPPYNLDYNNGEFLDSKSLTSSFDSTTTTIQPLSPPLSPAQRNVELNSIPIQQQNKNSLSSLKPTTKHLLPAFTTKEEELNSKTNTTTDSKKLTKQYLNTNSEFKIENFKNYKLSINIKPNKNYYQNQFEFLDKYSDKANQERNSTTTNFALPVRKYKKRINLFSSTDDEYSEVESIRGTRSRRTPKHFDNSVFNSDSEKANNDSALSTPPPKKRKTIVKTSSSPSIPIAIQQQMLIDESIPDYSPNAFETLPENNSKCLKIEWKGQPMDLSKDPNLHKYKLHQSEIILASILRLPIAVYMDSKRRFFFEKINKLKLSKQFRRTDAQKACRIDVNKASRLFAAFEKVGWLNDELFKKYL
ncbi:uncharacterized protein KGF55_000403 [Candida pseudojiufengensis]|uniref:uncharacterized protein n=1 Tax=Candida pseudojiufengensis TaxID=497109 RepID=UPI00222510FF|nr:uncharacterized protein KGF55_000403 [Candida pseudojiufengensis]KAI5966994.1 hypothetical protein KGF55_000403 [Candida pseudojiufengensis]